MKENIIEKVLKLVAQKTADSTSIMYLYEPKVPEVLVEKEDRQE